MSKHSFLQWMSSMDTEVKESSQWPIVLKGREEDQFLQAQSEQTLPG